jgi:hypothetical protein
MSEEISIMETTFFDQNKRLPIYWIYTHMRKAARYTAL